MGIKYSKGDVYGLQFHPESILCKYGYKIINVEEKIKIKFSFLESGI